MSNIFKVIIDSCTTSTMPQIIPNSKQICYTKMTNFIYIYYSGKIDNLNNFEEFVESCN